MHPFSEQTAPRWTEAHAARTANASLLARLLCASRARTLALVDAYEAALGAGLPVPCSPQLNPPLWELGHIGWFQEYWLARNPQRTMGTKADPDAPRMASCLPHADALYNSSLVPHASRWHLPLPDLHATKAFLKTTLAATLTLLADESNSDAALYFYRLALFHEDMHSEAAVYMAQALGVALPPTLAPMLIPHCPSAATESAQAIRFEAADWSLGYANTAQATQPDQTAPGFAFDNELAPHTVTLNTYEVEDRPVSWRRYLPFIAAGAHTDPRYWSVAGWQWRTAQITAQTPTQLGICPRYLRQSHPSTGGPVWEHFRFGQWHALNLDAPVCHLSYFEAEAWCRWAGRQLPTEAQWEQAAMTRPDFLWGEVWEWTASTFNPYPGFEAHPYRDYSAPWFGNRPVLRGASLATSARMRHPRYRNYYTPERNDIYAGFRTCVG